MPDFTALLRPRVGETKRPPVLPPEIYPGIVKSYEYGENHNKTPYVRYMLGLIAWPDNIPEEKRVNPDGGAPIDLSRRQLRRDFFLTPDAYYRLTEFLESCGINIPQTPNGELDLEAACPQVVGYQVSVEVLQYLNQTTNEIGGNNVGRLFGHNSR